MKEALLSGRLNEIGEILDFGFQQKRNMAHNISEQLVLKKFMRQQKKQVQPAEK